MTNEKVRFILWLSRAKGIAPPSLFNLITHNLNHVSVFLLTLRLSCLPLGLPAPTYPT